MSPTPVRARNPGTQIPEDLERVIMAALHWNADMRTPTAARLHDELSALRAVHAGERDEGLFGGRIELREHLATGAEAEVFRAYHRKLRRPVALKRLLASLQGNPDDRARFEREAWVLASVRHVGLPEVHDSGVADGRSYTIMELCAGRPARRFCEDEAARLRVDEVLSVGIQVAEALRAVHAIGVIHRDLSAQNVLIEAGRQPRVKVIDFTGCLLTDRFFGLRDEPRPEDDLEVTRDRTLHMLPFAAPEVQTDRRWSERSDVFALGVLLYRLLTGKMPFTAKARDKYISLPRNHPGSGVDRVLAAMLRPNPADRLPDMRAVAERLSAALDDEEADEANEDAPPARPQLALVTTSDVAPVDAEFETVAPVADVGNVAVAVAVAAITTTEDDAAPPAPSSEAAEAGLAIESIQPTVDSVGVASSALDRGSRWAWQAPAAGLIAGLAAALLWAPSVPLPVLTAPTSPTRIPILAASPIRPPLAPMKAEHGPPPPPPHTRSTTPTAPTDGNTHPDGLPRLSSITVKRRLAPSMAACSSEWLALTLHVAGGLGRVDKINGFAPKVDPAHGSGRVATLHRCVVDAVAAVRFPKGTPDLFTVNFDTTAEKGAALPARQR